MILSLLILSFLGPRQFKSNTVVRSRERCFSGKIVVLSRVVLCVEGVAVSERGVGGLVPKAGEARGRLREVWP